jgi:hypothetical protein
MTKSQRTKAAANHFDAIRETAKVDDINTMESTLSKLIRERSIDQKNVHTIISAIAEENQRLVRSSTLHLIGNKMIDKTNAQAVGVRAATAQN